MVWPWLGSAVCSTGNMMLVVLVLCTLPIQTWSLLMCALVDQMPTRQVQLDKIQSLSVALAEPSFSDSVLEVSCSISDSTVVLWCVYGSGCLYAVIQTKSRATPE